MVEEEEVVVDTAEEAMVEEAVAMEVCTQEVV